MLSRKLIEKKYEWKDYNFYQYLEKNSVDIHNKKTKFITKGRHDPCVGIRAVPIAEAMIAIILVDQIMMHEAQVGNLAR